MKSSLKIDFDEKGAVLLFNEQVTGTRNTAQKCLVNVGTLAGSSPMYSFRGTSLLLQAVHGELISVGTAQHAANFAALDTVLFVRNTDDPDRLSDTDRVTDMSLSVTGFSGQLLHLEASITFADATVIGLTPKMLFG